MFHLQWNAVLNPLRVSPQAGSQFAIQMSKSSKPADNDGKNPHAIRHIHRAAVVIPVKLSPAKLKEGPPLACETIPTGGNGQAEKAIRVRHKSIRSGMQ